MSRRILFPVVWIAAFLLLAAILGSMEQYALETALFSFAIYAFALRGPYWVYKGLKGRSVVFW